MKEFTIGLLMAISGVFDRLFYISEEQFKAIHLDQHMY